MAVLGVWVAINACRASTLRKLCGEDAECNDGALVPSRFESHVVTDVINAWTGLTLPRFVGLTVGQRVDMVVDFVKTSIRESC